MTKFQRNTFVDLNAVVRTTFKVSTRFAVSIIRVIRLLYERIFCLRFRILFLRAKVDPGQDSGKAVFSVMFHIVLSGRTYMISNCNRQPNVAPRAVRAFPRKSCSLRIYFRFQIVWCEHVFLNAACPLVALAALAGSQLRSNGSGGVNINNRSGGGQQTHEMTVPNDLIGCIIGKGGTKIAEIR